MECWASCIGGCGGATSREHYVSGGIFDDTLVRAFGLPWCLDKPITIGLGSAVAKILCQTHNSALSTYDAEAKRLSLFLSQNVVEQPEKTDTLHIQGNLFEKWLLKTMLNLGYIRGLEIGVHLIPPKELVRVLFSGESLENGAGLHFISGTMTSHQFQNGISWNAIRNTSGVNEPVVGMAITFNGIHFAVTISQVSAIKPLRTIGLRRGVDYSNAQILYRPSNIVLGSTSAGQKRIELSW